MRDGDSDRDRSEIEPIEVIFRAIAQKEQQVPKSVERGAVYQGSHHPAPSTAKTPSDVAPLVLLDVTTAPDPHRQRATRTAVAICLAMGAALVRLISC